MQNSLLSYASIIIFSIITVKSYASITAKNYETFVCPPGEFFKPHPYPGDCSKFIECNNGEKTAKECDPCTAFDKNRLICYDRKKAQCDYINYNLNESTCENGHLVVKERNEEYDQKIFCPKDLFGIFPYPFSKGMYFKCVDGNLFIKQCRPGAVYNILTKFCEGNADGEPELKFKFNETQSYITCPRGLNETFLYPFDCTKYIRCTPHGTRVETCKYGRYSIYYKRCLTDRYLTRADRVDCFYSSVGYGIGGDRSDAAYLGVYCPRGVSLYKAYPHPSNWQKYVVCENNSPKVKNCPSNQVFDVETRECSDKPEAETDERK